ncbi:hypothetical protein ACTXT7_014157 [Hymenolepis weldensis]
MELSVRNWHSKKVRIIVTPCGVHKVNKADRIKCARTGWKVRYVTGRIENKRGRACRYLLSQSALKIPAA